MDKVKVLVPVSVIVDAIVTFYGGDTERVLAFYKEARSKLAGTKPEIDTILNGIDLWLDARLLIPAEYQDDDEEWGEYVPCLSQ